jgi:hypothetical protein
MPGQKALQSEHARQWHGGMGLFAGSLVLLGFMVGTPSQHQVPHNNPPPPCPAAPHRSINHAHHLSWHIHYVAPASLTNILGWGKRKGLPWQHPVVTASKGSQAS